MRLWLGCLATLIAIVALPTTAQADDPSNDNYVPVAVCVPAPACAGQLFPHALTYEWSIGPGGDDADSTIDEADTQPDMFDTSSTPEDLNCEEYNPDVFLAKTVWYWVYPDVNGYVQVRTSGGDAVIRIVTVASGSGLSSGNNTPDFSDSACADDPTDLTSEELFVSVQGGAGRRYAVQVGVYNDGTPVWGAGQHLTRITFFRDQDLDSTFDPGDRCPTTSGPAAKGGCPDSDGDGLVNIDDRCPTAAGSSGLRGCPDGDGDGIPNVDDRCATQSASARDKNRNGCLDYAKFGANVVNMPNSTLFSRSGGGFVRNGVRITKLSVSGLPSGSSVQVSCSKRSICRKQTKRGRRVSFGKLKGRKLRPGRRVVVTVSKSGYITRRFVIKAKAKGKRGVSRSNRCVVPGTRRLVSCGKVSTVR